jgi:hypothetical protein
MMAKPRMHANEHENSTADERGFTQIEFMEKKSDISRENYLRISASICGYSVSYSRPFAVNLFSVFLGYSPK